MRIIEKMINKRRENKFEQLIEMQHDVFLKKIEKLSIKEIKMLEEYLKNKIEDNDALIKEIDKTIWDISDLEERSDRLKLNDSLLKRYSVVKQKKTNCDCVAE